MIRLPALGRTSAPAMLLRLVSASLVEYTTERFVRGLDPRQTLPDKWFHGRELVALYQMPSKEAIGTSHQCVCHILVLMRC